ncbi:Hsp20 family protein [Acidisoma silvae]|uniref:Hsp20 family protein n=1 Tax=Acidisoma silvae TaxID=2802396 RepID=A0A964DXA3_9PROT|nr:Hsp20 family protein [Acidisoma silvae]MCB8873689.1 Hsp20 family protein [Acidisoma silvae]
MTRDFTPLFRTAIGFDRLAQMVEGLQDTSPTTFPPYNIEKTGEDAYRVTVAVAGFAPDDLDVTVRDNTLLVSGRVQQPQGEKVATLYRGIAGRSFERRFALADHIVVEGASLDNGLLHIALKRVVPEALKPRRIGIATVNAAQKVISAELPASEAPAQAA